MVWRLNDPQGNEAAKIKWDIVPYTRGRGLDLGCGPHKPFNHFLGVDNKDHARQFGWQFEPDVTVDTCENLDMFADNSMDFAFSSHLLEHIVDYKATLKEWFRVVKPGGHLVLYLPHKLLYPNIGQPGGNPDHKHDFMPRDIADAMIEAGAGWDLIENETRDEGFEYSFYQVYRKRDDKRCNLYPVKTASKRACVVRYGGFGDMIQASSVFPALREQGFEVTVMTTPKGKDILWNDPNVNAFILQDNDQVPNGELGAYWQVWAKKFDRFINLCESVEGTLLSLPSRISHSWPPEVRHKMMNVNYLEYTHMLAQVPFTPKPQFYPTDDELEWVLQEIVGLDGFAIMVVLAGSSVHKAWPNLDYLMARTLHEIPEAKFVLVGDHACEMLEGGWQNEQRVFRRSGLWSIRKTMAAALNMDLVIGPETGVMNAVSYAKVGKIVLLSHSSIENLTKGWINTDSIEPANTPCYPCHMLHYDRKFCPEKHVPVESHPIHKDPKLVEEMTKEGHIKDGMFATGAALCAAHISPDVVFDKVKEHYERWRANRGIQKAD